jgi:hypothetical protein
VDIDGNGALDTGCLSTLSKLTTLIILECKSIASVSLLTQLEILDIQECEHFKVASLSTLTNLKKLFVKQDPYFFYDHPNIACFSKLINLSLLTLENCVDVVGDIAALQMLTELKCLHLINCGPLEGNINVLSSLQKLSEVCINFNDDYIEFGNGLKGNIEVLAGLKNLSRCELSGMDEITGHISVFANLDKLKCLKIVECPGIEGPIFNKMDENGVVAPNIEVSINLCPYILSTSEDLTSIDLKRVARLAKYKYYTSNKDDFCFDYGYAAAAAAVDDEDDDVADDDDDDGEDED